jgi:hypothetical protein
MKSFENDYVKCNININQNKLLISGNIKNASMYKNLAIMSPNPPYRISSHSGKNLPFPCEAIAFENTPNFKIIGPDGYFNVEFDYPNSYYSPDGLTKIVSPIIFSLDAVKIIYELEDRDVLKTLRDRKRGDPFFYSTRELILPVGTAEQVMNNYAYAKIHNNIA